MGKTKEQKKLDALDARVRALETHNGWTPGEVHEEADDATDEQPTDESNDQPSGD